MTRKRTNDTLQNTKRKVMNHPLMHAFICRLVWGYCWLVYATSRVERVVDEGAKPYINGDKHFTLAFWHGRLLMEPFVKPKGREMHVLISAHGDGKLISKTMTYFGIDTVEGSSSKGAIGAVKGMLKVLKREQNICITPDGPRGPFQTAADGVVHVPAKSKVPVVPSAFSAKSAKQLRSWDKFMIPFPFSTLIYVVGAPVHITDLSDESAIEAARLSVENALNDVTDHADMLAGRTITE